ncbi:MAG: recD, partial [Ramlibacter sp.]|nr:recD [Ramlibacter sp.]
MTAAAVLPAASVACLAQLEAWVEAGWLRDLDVVFAKVLAQEAPDAQPLLLLAAALASHQLGR